MRTNGQTLLQVTFAMQVLGKICIFAVNRDDSYKKQGNKGWLSTLADILMAM